ncbi:hypothetical protein LJR130_003027 [Variovorax sp. LjRoot130]|uniref:hypothetical protein n=1 Tax=Variovorax sp. LjRoot130 TaxID=3342261 RepID=UPI003ECD16D0
MADRDGRPEDRPKRIKAELFPFDTIDVEPLLKELERWKFIVRYEVDGLQAIQILKFSEHQKPSIPRRIQRHQAAAFSGVTRSIKPHGLQEHSGK